MTDQISELPKTADLMSDTDRSIMHTVFGGQYTTSAKPGLFTMETFKRIFILSVLFAVLNLSFIETWLASFVGSTPGSIYVLLIKTALFALAVWLVRFLQL